MVDSVSLRNWLEKKKRGKKETSGFSLQKACPLLDEPLHRVPGKMKRREVELDLQVSPEEIKSREVELDPQPRRVMNREVELGCESWTSFASGCFSTAVQQTLSLWLCPAWQLKQQLRSALVAEQWRGDTALTLPLFLQRSRVSPVFLGKISAVKPPLFHPLSPPPPPPPPPVPNKQPRLCGCKATWSRSRWTKCYWTEWKWIYSTLE